MHRKLQVLGLPENGSNSVIALWSALPVHTVVILLCLFPMIVPPWFLPVTTYGDSLMVAVAL